MALVYHYIPFFFFFFTSNFFFLIFFNSAWLDRSWSWLHELHSQQILEQETWNKIQDFFPFFLQIASSRQFFPQTHYPKIRNFNKYLFWKNVFVSVTFFKNSLLQADGLSKLELQLGFSSIVTHRVVIHTNFN